MSGGVRGTAGGGGEDKERSGTGAALTPERPVLEESPAVGRERAGTIPEDEGYPASVGPEGGCRHRTFHTLPRRQQPLPRKSLLSESQNVG